jgi:hypothetical protein
MGHTFHPDVLINEGPFNGGEEFLFPGDVTAMTMLLLNTLLMGLSDAGVNKPTALPLI